MKTGRRNGVSNEFEPTGQRRSNAIPLVSPRPDDTFHPLYLPIPDWCISMKRIDRRTYIALVAGGTVAVAGCGGNGDADPDEPETDDESTADTETNDASEDESDAETADDTTESVAQDGDESLEIGEVLEIGDLQLVVADVDRVDDVARGDGDLLEADSGTVFAAVDVAVQYTGGEDVVAVDEAVTVAIADGDDNGDVDADGESYERASALDDEPGDPTRSRLAPGELTRGEIVYEVDDDADTLVLEIDSLIGGETAVVDLEAAADEPVTFEQDVDALGFSQGVESAGVEVTVTTLEQGNNLGGFMQSDAGNEVVAVGVSLENGSGRDRTLSPGQARLKDEFGREYADAPGVVRALEGFDEEVLEAGDEHEGKVAYQLEEGAAELYWVFDFGEWGEDRRVFWKLR
ncbi:hypothetical protein C494_14388 [Natronorubrum bangense JCM 10635]|uniref:DUF4352 domain-containing protein n=2 Tax=Natronorubrum bangense TaxID=61858 RepID=L9WAM6_9EURY|nr:hypothetical protein C494_14388 [Natronorubrum bangense JCM 10635]